MKSNGTLTNQKNISVASRMDNAEEQLFREQLVELVEAQLAAIGGGGDQPSI